MRGGSEQGAHRRYPPPQYPSEPKRAEGASRGDTGAVPTSITHLFTCGWHSDDPGWPPNENAHQKPLLLPKPIPCCQQTAHGPLTHCQPNETSALMKPLWALLVRQQRAMKTLTIHFMDWAVVRADNTILINETGLVSWRKGGHTKVQLVTAFKATPMDWLAAGGGGKLSGLQGGKHPRRSNKDRSNPTAALHLAECSKSILYWKEYFCYTYLNV